MLSGLLWEDGYFAFTVGDRMTRVVIARYSGDNGELKQVAAQI